MNPMFTSYSIKTQSPRTQNVDDITHVLSNNLAAINLNVNIQQSPKKEIANIPHFCENTNSVVTYINDCVINNGDLAPIYYPAADCTNVGAVLNGGEDKPNAKMLGSNKNASLFQNASLVQEFIPRNKINNAHKEPVSKLTDTNLLDANNKKHGSVSTFQDLSVASVPEFIPRGAYTKSISDPVVSDTPLPDSPTLNDELINAYADQSLEDDPSAASITTYQENVNGTVYFYTAPLTSSNTSPVDGLSTSPTLKADPAVDPMINASTVVANGVAPLAMAHQPIISDPASSVYYIQDGLAPELIMLQSTNNLYPPIPEKVGENYCNIEPLEPLPAVPSGVLSGYITSTYKATHVKTGVNYFMRRIHGVSLPSTKCNALVNNWKKLSHTNLVHLREMIVTRDFGDNSIVFVYDYYADSETLLARHFSSQNEGLNDTFSSDPNAPRPYSHTKNALLRQQHSTMLPESILWSYAIQLTGALRVIHAAGLSCRCLDASKVIITNRNRVRLSGVCVFDVILYDHSPANRLQLTSHFQQEDLSELGKLLLALACGSLIAIQKENLQTSLEVMSRTYSNDIRNLIAYLLHSNQRRSILELMPMIGARFYSQIDAMQLQCDILDTEIRKENDYAKLLKLVIKLACVNEWPDVNLEQPWAETGDRYMLTLFRDYLYHQMSEDRRPWIDINQIIHSLNKLLDGSSEKICLVPRNEETVLVMSYDEMKQCFERSFSELSEMAAYVTEDSTEKGQNAQDT
ncbi:PAN2-PAN3 deadenylation complex subunit PAN3 isoform X2 [Planococcus citri]|uniref:PAN2-PAN3 deadenylation complex subunit PAN3 isoform X2 n=1 Tax=Planococcus citri TaxID=170843 RepID=UPI0031F73E02